MAHLMQIEQQWTHYRSALARKAHATARRSRAASLRFTIVLKRTMMKYSEFRRWLLDRGAFLKAGKGSHLKVSLNGKSTVFPFHGAKEIGTGLVAKIKRDLGLKD
jgi:mRNA interferase HicA